ncbi:MAG: hypothetical protein ACJ73D_07235 [Pyrinomonadaceae bacterium]
MYYSAVQQECSDLKDEAGAASDNHYRAMTNWLTKGRTSALRRKARSMAEKYRKALTWLIGCYRRARGQASQHSLEQAETYRSLLEQDIEILDSNP